MIVVALIALASGSREPRPARPGGGAARAGGGAAAALLEAARAEARAAGVAVRWQLAEPDAAAGTQGARGFRFVGLPGDRGAADALARSEGVSAQVVGARAVSSAPSR